MIARRRIAARRPISNGDRHAIDPAKTVGEQTYLYSVDLDLAPGSFNVLLSPCDVCCSGRGERAVKGSRQPPRLIIICQLIEKERSVGELAALPKIRHSTVLQHLALLRKDGLVTARRDGQTIWYSIGSPQARALVRTIYRVYCGPAGAPTLAARR